MRPVYTAPGWWIAYDASVVSRPVLKRITALLIPSLVFVGLYLRALDYEFVWTDLGEIEQGSLVRRTDRILDAFSEPMHGDLDFRLAGVPQSFYRPLQVALVSLIHARHGATPRYYRAANLAIGAATALLFAAFAQLLFQRVELAVLAGLIFAVHPGGIEVYVWIAGLSSALANFFVVGSVLAAALALRADRPGPGAALVGLSAATFALGLASKEHAVVTPVLVLVCAASLGVLEPRGGRQPRGRRSFLSTTAGLLLVQGSIALAYVAWWRPRVLGSAFTGAPLIGGHLDLQWFSSAALVPRNLLWLVFPLHSTTSDVVRVVSSMADPMVWMGIVLAAVSLIGWFVLLRRGHVVAALGLAWVWIAYIPTSGVVPLLHARAERNLCLSIFGAALLWPAAIAPLLRMPGPSLRRAITVALAFLPVLVLAERAWARTPDWRSNLELFERDVSRDPLYREGMYQLGAALFEAGRAPEAKRHLEALLAIGPRFAGHWSYLRMPDSYELYCWINRAAGRAEDTVGLLDGRFGGRLVSAEAMPGFSFCVGLALEASDRFEEAIDLYTRLIPVGDPRARALFTVGIARCHATLGRLAQAKEWLTQVDSTGVRDPTLDSEIRTVRRLIRRASRPAGRRRTPSR